MSDETVICATCGSAMEAWLGDDEGYHLYECPNCRAVTIPACDWQASTNPRYRWPCHYHLASGDGNETTHTCAQCRHSKMRPWQHTYPSGETDHGENWYCWHPEHQWNGGGHRYGGGLPGGWWHCPLWEAKEG